MKPNNYAYFTRFVWKTIPLLLCAGSLFLFPTPANAQKNVLKQLFKKQISAQTQEPVRRFVPSAVESKRMRQELARQKRAGGNTQKYSAAKAAGLTQQEMAFSAPLSHVPKLQKVPPVVINDFTDYLPPVKLPAPYPLSLYPGDLARGMLLLHPKEDLQTIFSKGLLTARSAVDGWTKKRLIFMTNVPQIAHIYTYLQEPGVPVIVHIAGFKGENKHIWTTSHDIPAKNIVRVSAYLKIKGKERWGQIVPRQDGSFAFYPYQLSFSQKVKLNLLRALQNPQE